LLLGRNARCWIMFPPNKPRPLLGAHSAGASRGAGNRRNH
jgi:hypothetical protein